MTKPKKSATPSPKKTSASEGSAGSRASEAAKSPTAKAAAAKPAAPKGPVSGTPGAKSGGAQTGASTGGSAPATGKKPGVPGGGAAKADPAGKPAEGKVASPKSGASARGGAAAPAASNAPSVPKNGAKNGRTGGASAGAAAAKADPASDEPLPPRKLPKGGPSKADLKRYRERLLDLRRELLASSRDLEAEVLKSSGTEFSVDHMADNGSDNYEHDFSLKLLEGEAEQLAEIREALLKIDGKLEPPYGVCEACVDADQKLCPTCPWIPSARLDAMPHARMCVQTKELEERKRR